MAVDIEGKWSVVELFNGSVPAGTSFSNPMRLVRGWYALNSAQLGGLYTLVSGPGTLTVTLQHSVDGINWLTLAAPAAQTATVQVGTTVAQAPLPFLRFSFNNAGGTWTYRGILSGSGFDAVRA